jgi:signal transduction histidine kinase
MSLDAIKLAALAEDHQVATIDPNGTLLNSCHSVLDLRDAVGEPFFDRFSTFVGLHAEVMGLSEADPEICLPKVSAEEFGTEEHLDFRFCFAGEGQPLLLLISTHSSVNRHLKDTQQQRNETAIALEHQRGRNESVRAENGSLRSHASELSHDLKAPLRALSHLAIWIEEAVTTADSDKAAEYLGLMRSRVEQMTSLVDGRLDAPLDMDDAVPMSSPAVTDGHAARPMGTPGDSPGSKTGPVQIVVLDDDVVDLEMFRRCVASISDLPTVVRTCRTEEETEAALSEGPCDLLFVDYRLEGASGVEVLNALRAKGHSPTAILLSGGSGDDVIRDAVLGGFADFMPKRFVVSELMGQVIRSNMEKSRLQTEVSEKQAELAATVNRLRSSREEVRLLYHRVGHELKTPLTGAREFASLIRDGAVGPVSDQQSKLLGAITRNCDRMTVCINDMLDAARLDSGKLALNVREADLSNVLTDTVESLRTDADAKGISLDLAFEVPSEKLRCSIDPDRVFQVAGNLLSNAIKFTPQGGSIRVSVASDGPDSLRVSVKDTGCGLAPEDLGRIFDRLIQSREEDATVLGGLGMGLYICREIVHLHGGEISVSSEVGAGSDFAFTLPTICP